MRLIFLLLTLSIAFPLFSQTYFTRTGHLQVRSENKYMNLAADNYQVFATLDAAGEQVELTGLVKSFEFELGVADRLFSSQRVQVVEHPKIRFAGAVPGLAGLDLSRTGEYPVDIEGRLFIWGYERRTTAQGLLQVLDDGSLQARARFVMTIEEESMAKVNELLRRHLPAAIQVDTDRLGISLDIDVAISMTLRRR